MKGVKTGDGNGNGPRKHRGWLTLAPESSGEENEPEVFR